MAELEINFNVPAFLNDLAPILRKKKYTYGNKDIVNQCVFSKRRELDPNFIIPAAHVNRWQAVNESNDSDCAASELDSDEETIPVNKLQPWITSLLEHVQVVLYTIHGNIQRRAWAIEFANCAQLNVKQRSRLDIL